MTLTSINKDGVQCTLENELERIFNRGNRVILYNYDNQFILNMLSDSLDRLELSSVIIWHCIEKYTDSKCTKKIDRKMMEDVIELYKTYDFSDKIIVLDKSEQYGDLLNYVRNGVLTVEEMIDALLYKI